MNMDMPVLKMSTSGGGPGSERYNRLYQLIGDVNRARRVAGLPFPFGPGIVALHDEQDMLVVHWAKAESAVQYGQFVVDAWREFQLSRLEFVLPDGQRVQLEAGSAGPGGGPAVHAIQSAGRPHRPIEPKAFTG
jgi:hypothetical protein